MSRLPSVNYTIRAIKDAVLNGTSSTFTSSGCSRSLIDDGIGGDLRRGGRTGSSGV